MPNKGSPLKCVYTLRMPRDLRAKCQRLADAAGLDLSAWICRQLAAETIDVELSADEIHTIEMEVRDAERANAYR